MYTRLLSAIKMEQICEPYIRKKAMRHLEKGRIVISVRVQAIPISPLIPLHLSGQWK